MGDGPRQSQDASAAIDLTVADLRNLFLQAMEERVARGEYNIRSYQQLCFQTRYFRDLPGMAALPCGSLTVNHAEVFREWATKQGYAPGTVAGLLRAVGAMLGWATRPKPGRVPARLMPTNPWTRLEVPRHAPNKLYADPAELRRFLRCCWGLTRKQHDTYRVYNRAALRLIRLARLTGARPGELCGLQWSDILPDRSMIVLPPTRHKTGRTTGKHRHIFLPQQADRMLRGLPRRDDGHVFGWAGGRWTTQCLDYRFARWRRQLEAHGFDRVIPYDLRHTYCSDALAGGASYADVSKLVGNSPEILAGYYDHPVLDRLSDVAAGIAARRTGPRKGSKRGPASRE